VWSYNPSAVGKCRLAGRKITLYFSLNDQNRKEIPLRIVARLKLGYYPLPVEQGPLLRARLLFPEAPTAALDPCCGTGAALRALTAASNTTLYGVELDSNRAEAAEASGIQTIQGNAFDVRARVERLSFLYLNPPYDFEVGPRSNERMEKLFLGHTYAWLKPKGVLLMVIPCNAVYDVADTLSTRFTDIAIYLLVGEESEKYNQCAIFGVRHNNNGNDTVRWRQNIHRMMYTPRSLPVLTPEVDRMYSVPPNGNVEIYYTGLPLDEIEDRLVTSNAWKHAVPLLLPKQEVAEGHPLTPLHGGHVGLLTTAGMLNGKIRNAPDPDAHLAHWRPIKHTTTTVEYEDNIEITRTRERFSNEVAIVFVDGRTQILTETKQDEPEVEDGEDSETPEDSAAAAEFAGDDKEDGSCKLFQLGRLTMSRGVQALVVDGFDLGHLLARYKRGEWGDTDQEDIDANNRAVMHDARIFSSYEVPESPDGRIWIITEHDRSSTNVILPSEY
jgi:tRNA1(Val) A37 N6-methylase TrmN6